MTSNGFFAVGRETFISATNLGINPAAVFLTMARGSGGDNITTSWSAEAASTRLGTRWTTAKEAIAQLEHARLIKRDKTSTRTHPRYTLTKKGDLIWLPNSLIDPVGNEIPPVTKIRQTQDPMTLRLFVEFYAEQNLREDGGISPQVTWQEYERERVGARAQYTIWRFHGEKPWARMVGNQTLGPHALTREEIDAGGSRGDRFFPRLKRLVSLGLIRWVPYLFEGPEGEPIHPLDEGGVPAERELFAACAEAAENCLAEYQHTQAIEEGGILVPVPAHIEQATVIGVARLHYRPHTRLTSAWWAEHNAQCQAYASRYRDVPYGSSSYEVA